MIRPIKKPSFKDKILLKLFVNNHKATNNGTTIKYMLTGVLSI